MRFELRPEYPDWKGNTRKALYVDQEAFAAIKRICDAPDVDDRLARLLPADVLAELKRPMYAGPHIFGLTVRADEDFGPELGWTSLAEPHPLRP